MTLEMRKTGLEGFLVRYGEEVVAGLNEINSDTTLNHRKLRAVGERVSGFVKGDFGPRTRDGYRWYERLDFDLGSGRVAVLFPWCYDAHDIESIQDRSINVYGDKGVLIGEVEELLGEIMREIGSGG